MERERLLSSTSRYKTALEGQVADLKQNAAKLVIQGLVFGGVALGSYLLVRAFRKGSKKVHANAVAKTSFTSTIFASIQSYILSFVLAMIREKLTAYLENHFLNQDDSAQQNKRQTEPAV